MHRFFSRFADGWAGGALLLLRAVVAFAAITHGLAQLTGGPSAALDVAGAALAIASSLAVLAGVWTTASAVTLAATVAWCCVPVHAHVVGHDVRAALLTCADAVAISLLGPGAFSIDARLFGPREIVIPRDGRVPKT